MVKTFEDFVNEEYGSHNTGRNWGFSRALTNKETFERFMLRKTGTCLVLCDDSSVNRNELFEDGLGGIDYVYKVGDFTVEPAASAQEIDEETLMELKNGALIDSKVIIFVRYDIPAKWDNLVKTLLDTATHVIKLNNIDYKNRDRSGTVEDFGRPLYNWMQNMKRTNKE